MTNQECQDYEETPVAAKSWLTVEFAERDMVLHGAPWPISGDATTIALNDGGTK